MINKDLANRRARGKVAAYCTRRVATASTKKPNATSKRELNHGSACQVCMGALPLHVIANLLFVVANGAAVEVGGAEGDGAAGMLVLPVLAALAQTWNTITVYDVLPEDCRGSIGNNDGVCVCANPQQTS